MKEVFEYAESFSGIVAHVGDVLLEEKEVRKLASLNLEICASTFRYTREFFGLSSNPALYIFKVDNVVRFPFDVMSTLDDDSKRVPNKILWNSLNDEVWFTPAKSEFLGMLSLQEGLRALKRRDANKVDDVDKYVLYIMGYIDDEE